MTAFLVIVLAQGKFYLLFSFLFGYSASFILRQQLAESTTPFASPSAVLFLFGLVHAVFFFFGDILIAYSILGLFLFALSRLSDRAFRPLGHSCVLHRRCPSGDHCVADCSISRRQCEW